MQLLGGSGTAKRWSLMLELQVICECVCVLQKIVGPQAFTPYQKMSSFTQPCTLVGICCVLPQATGDGGDPLRL